MVTTACWTILSSRAAISHGRFRPYTFSMYTHREGSARYAPRLTRLCRSVIRPSSPVSYSSHVMPSTPGAAFRFKERKLSLSRIDGHVMEQRSELQLLTFPCCFPHTRQPLGHACLALCRVRARLENVLLDQWPSLLTLRQQFLVFVRMIHRYCATVRLLGDVHAGRVA